MSTSVSAAALRPPAAAASRIAWLDYARGLAIALVVYGHCYRGLSAQGLSEPDSALRVVDYVIYTFHMPLFFLISGVLAGRRDMFAKPSFWLRKAEAIVWPYLLWMSVQLLVLSIFSRYTNQGAVTVGWGTYVYDPASPFWFLYALFASHIFLSLMSRFGALRMLAAAACVFAAGRFAGEGELLRDATWGLLYFVLGAVATDTVRAPAFIAYVSRTPVILFTVIGALGSAMICFLSGLDNELAIPSALLGCLAIFGIAHRLAMLAATARPLQVISYVGQISLTVLVIHLYGTAGARIALSAMHVHAVSPHLIAGVLAGLALPVGVQLVCTRLNLLRLLGLPRLNRVSQPRSQDIQPGGLSSIQSG